MQIRIVAVGRLKERWWQEAAAEYTKRLSRFGQVTVCEVEDEHAPDHVSEGEKRMILSREGERVLKKIPKGSFCIVLAIQGRKRSSEQLASFLEQKMSEGVSDLTFVIGGSYGLSEEVNARADELLSFSDMTFPHQLMRVMALEQIYRAYRILRHEPYHK